MTPILLDTCAVIWIAADAEIASAAAEALNDARDLTLFVSPMTAWEIGMLVARQRLTLTMDPRSWFESFVGVPGVRLAPLAVRTMVASSFLPGTPPRDPVDRILAATAREYGYRLMTRDRLLLDYAADGHISAIEC